MKLWYDSETRGEHFSKGTHRYRASGARIIMQQFAIDDGPITIVQPMRYPGSSSMGLYEAIEACDEIWAHEAQFDRLMLATEPNAPVIPIEKWRCTAALARMHGLPGGLDKLCTILKVPDDEAKHKRGKELIQLFCKPYAPAAPPDLGPLYNDWNSHPAEWEEFCQYGGSDITSMRAIHARLPHWNATSRMWARYHLDQKMNDRGIGVDMPFVHAAIRVTKKRKEQLGDEIGAATGYEVMSATQVARLKEYLKVEYNVALPDMTADTIERRLEDEILPEEVKELLRNRQQASKASTGKYQRVLDCEVGGRLRSTIVFCGAARTGRTAGRVFNPLNLPRPKHKNWEIENFIYHAKAGQEAELPPEDLMPLASSALRGVIVPASGNKLLAFDYANIESRYMAWMAGEDWKLEAFRAYDRREGESLYKIAYARPFGLDPREIKKDGDIRYQIGKVMELALQFFGGVGAFCNMADTYGLRLDDLASKGWSTIPKDYRERATGDYHRAVKRRRTYGLDERVWIVCHAIVLMWRDAHPAIVKFWADIEAAVKMVKFMPEIGEIQVGRIFVDCKHGWVRLKLPSGRYLLYPAMKLDDSGLSFVGINPYTRQWHRIGTYSGKLAENLCQGGSVDFIDDALLAAEEAGMNPVLSVYDEILADTPNELGYTHEDLGRVMTHSSPWAVDFPLAGEGFTTCRYRK